MLHGWLLQADYGSQATLFFIRGDGNGTWDRRGRKVRALRRFFREEMPDLPNKNKELTFLHHRTVKASLNVPVNTVGEVTGVGATTYSNVVVHGRLAIARPPIHTDPIRQILGSGKARMILEVGSGTQFHLPFFIV